MKDQFIPSEYFKIIANDDQQKEFYSATGILYQEAEEWLWEKHKIRIQIQGGDFKPAYKFLSEIVSYKEYGSGMMIAETGFNSYSPITAHREGILQAIAYINKNK